MSGYCKRCFARLMTTGEAIYCYRCQNIINNEMKCEKCGECNDEKYDLGNTAGKP